MMEKEKALIGYKGFDKDWKCQGFQYEVGKTYEKLDWMTVFLGVMAICSVLTLATNICLVTTATNTGSQSAATNTGDLSAATNTGDWSAATNTGDWSAATNTGNLSAAMVEGKDSVACGLGFENKVSGAKGCWLVLAERKDDGTIKTVKSVKVDGKKIKAGKWYVLKNGKFREDE